MTNKFLIAVSVSLLLAGCTPTAQSVQAQPTSTSTPAVEVKEIALADKPSLESTVKILAGDIGERNLARYEKLEQTRSYITRRMEKAGYEVELNSYRGKLDDREVHNLVLSKPGNDEILIVGAHYDSASITPGANDNGSGVAVLLELAERLKDVPLKRTIRFVFFVNEEPPYFMTSDMGSRVYAKLCAERKDKIVGMWSLETMGYYSDEPGSQHFPPGIEGYPDTGNFLAFVTEPNSEQFLLECLDNFEGLPVESLVAPGGLEGVSWSDHASFWDYGYPAIMVTDTALFRYPHYHRTSDTPDKLDYKRLDLAAQGLEQMIRVLAQEKE